MNASEFPNLFQSETWSIIEKASEGIFSHSATGPIQNILSNFMAYIATYLSQVSDSLSTWARTIRLLSFFDA